MKRCLIILCALCASVVDPFATIAATKTPKQPNVIVILGDDMGIDSVSAFNDKLGLKTPAIDRLAAEGMSFMDAHSTSAVCSPTRYGLLTGRYNWRSRLKRGIVGAWERPLIADKRITLPELFKVKGYDTCMIGKWHLGWHWPKKGGGTTQKLGEIDFTKPIKGGPVDHGFDYYYGDDVPNWPPFAWRENDRILTPPLLSLKGGAIGRGPADPRWDLTAVLLEYGKRTAEYVRGRKGKEAPFFLYFPMPSPHTPIAPGGRFKGISGISDYADFLIETDWAIGEILKALDDTGQADNTVVIFTCDNGTSPQAKFGVLEAKNVRLRANWRGWKADAYEGGHRVPFIVRWPGHIKPNTRSHETIVLTDIMATCASLLDTPLPANAGEDSVNLMPVLRGAKLKKPLHDIIINHSIKGTFAIRKGQWKLILAPGSGGWSPGPKAKPGEKLPIVQLFDLANDPKEQKNLHAQYPDKLKELAGELAKAFRNGRTTPGPKQKNEGWPNSIIKPVLTKFPELAAPKK